MTTMNEQDYQTLTYLIPHDEKGGSLFLLGNPKANRIVLICGGWPDDPTTFLPLARRMARRRAFLIGITCLPGYDKIRWRDGYSFPDCVACLLEAVKVLRARSKRPHAKLTGIFHELACIVGPMYANRAIRMRNASNNGLLLQNGLEQTLVPDELVLLDTCVSPAPTAALRQNGSTRRKRNMHNNLKIERCLIDALFTWLAHVTFQVNMALAFLTQYYISPDLAVLQYLAGYYIAERWFFLFPYISHADQINLAVRFEAVDMHHLMYMMYPYYYYCRARLCFWRCELQDCHLPFDLRETPVLFLYGSDKNVMFHSPATVALLEEEFMQCLRSKVVQVRNAGHWLHLQQEEVCHDEIIKFLDNSCVRFSTCKFRNER